jgi:hypothetical protein
MNSGAMTNTYFNIIVNSSQNKVTINNIEISQTFSVSGSENICLFDYAQASNNSVKYKFCNMYINGI